MGKDLLVFLKFAISTSWKSFKERGETCLNFAKIVTSKNNIPSKGEQHSFENKWYDLRKIYMHNFANIHEREAKIFEYNIVGNIQLYFVFCLTIMIFR